ncbi:SDR family oxidoreductase [Mycobacteroides sp. LB1]|uniref:SDR family NAD(P)-dependent oxidoreductase n=1 Tax=Mycobacteroides sp. LB1 TaxID=2750814 RepID=UPI0015DDDA9E|nr:SDR family oxidoreductase [Mycobacteroides sp. LB1]
MNLNDFQALYDLSGRTAIVTGGTRGIGYAIAEALGACGASVVVSSRKADACTQAASELHDKGYRALGVPAHMGDLEDIDRLVASTVDEYGGIDIVVNAAANPIAQPMGGYTPDALGKSFDVNVRGPVFLVQAALPHLTASEHASVLNVVSVAAFQYVPMLSMYAAMKATLMSFTRSMAAEYTGRGIRVNALAPGTVDTYMLQQNPQEIIDAMAAQSFMGRLASTDEMIGPALLLLSDAGSFITGQVIVADGGGLVQR